MPPAAVALGEVLMFVLFGNAYTLLYIQPDILFSVCWVDEASMCRKRQISHFRRWRCWGKCCWLVPALMHPVPILTPLFFCLWKAANIKKRSVECRKNSDRMVACYLHIHKLFDWTCCWTRGCQMCQRSWCLKDSFTCGWDAAGWSWTPR